MKAFDPRQIQEKLSWNTASNIIYLEGIFDVLCHISKQIENKQELEYCRCSNVGPNAIEPDMPVDGNGNCVYCKKPVERGHEKDL